MNTNFNISNFLHTISNIPKNLSKAATDLVDRMRGQKANSTEKANSDLKAHIPNYVAITKVVGQKIFSSDAERLNTIRRLTEFLEPGGIKEEGILRESGLETNKNTLIHNLKHNEPISQKEIHNAAWALKLILKETFGENEGFKPVSQFLQEINPNEINQDIIDQASEMLTPEQREILDLTLEFAAKVVENKTENLMGAKAIAIVLQPNLGLPNAFLIALINKKVEDPSLRFARDRGAAVVDTPPTQAEQESASTSIEATEVRTPEETTKFVEDSLQKISDDFLTNGSFSPTSLQLIGELSKIDLSALHHFEVSGEGKWAKYMPVTLEDHFRQDLRGLAEDLNEMGHLKFHENIVEFIQKYGHPE